MRRLAFVLAGGVFLALAASCRGGGGGVDKCCGLGDVLRFNKSGEFECVRTTDGQPRLQELLDLRPVNDTKGLPSCDDSSYLVQKLWEDASESTARIPPSSCLDIFLDEASGQNFPVIIQCNSVQAQSMTKSMRYYLAAEGRPPASSLPQLSKYRKCCPGLDSYYDAELKYCAEGRSVELRQLFGRRRRRRPRGVDFIDVYSGPPRCEHVLVDHKVPLADVYADARLQIAISWQEEGGETKRRNVTIDEKNACLDGPASSDFIVARLCQGAEYCRSNACIRKCCSENDVDASCLGSSPDNKLDTKSFRASLAQALPAFDYGLLTGKPCKLLYLDEDDVWEFGRSGEIVTLNDPYGLTFNHANSCLEYIYYENSPNLTDRLHALFCFEDDYEPQSTSYKHMITAGLALMSCFFLLAMLLVYSCLPALQNLHGKTIMCHAASLFFAYVCLATVMITTKQLLENVNDYVADMTCIYLGYAMLFCFDSAFLWLNAMCFDIWWTFGGMQGATSAATKRVQQRNRFLSYCVYAWGLSLLLTGLVIVMDNVNTRKFGRQRCWFDNTTAEVMFFISPISLTLLVNAVLFVVTARKCNKVKSEIKRVMANVKDPTTRKFHSDKTRLIMNLKLFIVMGIPWLLENGTAYLRYYQMPSWAEELTFVADVVNSLQGLWIFILFAMKPKVYRALRKRFGMEKLRDKSSNNLTVATSGGRNVLKSSSTSTLTSNFVLSSSS